MSPAGIITIEQKSVQRVGSAGFVAMPRRERLVGGKLKDEIKNPEPFVSPGRIIDGMHGASKGYNSNQ